MTSLRILVVSDLHANKDREPARRNDTYILSEPPPARPNNNPLTDLRDWAAQEGQSFDYVIVPGDIANQADAAGLAYAWDKLVELASAMDAKLIGAPGNHDVTTRKAAADPRADLKTLSPSFPTLNKSRDSDFWEDGWLLLDSEPDHRLLILDSTIGFPSFPAGVGAKTKAFKKYLSQLDRGSFPEHVQDKIEASLVNAPEKLNLLVVHHHPIEHQLPSHMRDTYGAMHRGSDLIHMLCKDPTMGRWIVIHGHKHIPQLVNAVTTTASGPLVLCAASLGHRLWPPINTTVRNQFHILEATNDPLPGVASVRGEVHSYFWGYGMGWLPAEPVGSGLPAAAGFGCTDDARTLGDQIVALMDDPSNIRDLLRADDLSDQFPQLRYQLPADAKFLREYLESHGFALTDHHGSSQLGRIT